MNWTGERKPKPRWRTRFLLIAAPLALGWLFFELRPGPPATVSFETDQPGIGQRPATVQVTLREPTRGLAGWRVEAVQDDRVTVLAERDHAARPGWAFWRSLVAEDTTPVVVGRDTVPGLTAGDMMVRVVARRAGTLLRRPAPVIVELPLSVSLEPPALDLLSRANYAEQGGSGVVVYRVGSAAMADGGHDGVEAGEWFFPGHPLPDGDDDERFALFGVPYDLVDAKRIRLVAVDALGNRATTAFLDDLELEPVRTDTINLSDGFFEAVVPEILSQTPAFQPTGTMLEQYLAINGDLRQQNAETLRQMAEKSEPAFLWQGAFEQLPNSQVTSAFADRRTYVYDGRPVDRQDHLGFDLASVRRAPVPSSNDGTVALARYFGIYGKTVVVDHGYGLMSLYSHLSSIEVEEGQAVTSETVLGHTGETGLAAGDHLHFTMMLRGLAVNPVEWWDGRWVEHRILAPLRAR